MEGRIGPPEGTAWRPATSGNSVSWDGEAVVKRFGSNLPAYHRESAILSQLTSLAVPKLLPGSEPGVLRLEYLDGVSGIELIEAGAASAVLLAAGNFLRSLQDVDVEPFRSVLPGTGKCLVHGDFAPYNFLFDPESYDLLAVIDWEAAYVGDPVTDLAWCEFQVRSRFPRESWAVGKLFEGFGSTPEPAERERAVAERLEFLNRGGHLP